MKEKSIDLNVGDFIARDGKISVVMDIIPDNSTTSSDNFSTIVVEGIRFLDRYEIKKKDLHKYEIYKKGMIDSIKIGVSALTKSSGGHINELVMADGSISEINISQLNESNIVRLVDTLKINDLVYFGMSIYRISEIVTIGTSRHGLTMDDLLCNDHKVFLDNSDIDRMSTTLTDENNICRYHDFLGTYNYNELNTFIHRVFKEIRDSYFNTPDYINKVYSGTNVDRLMDNLYKPNKAVKAEKVVEYNEKYLVDALRANIDINDDVQNLNLHDIVLYEDEITIVNDIRKTNKVKVDSFSLMSVAGNKSNIKKVYEFDNNVNTLNAVAYDEELKKLKHLGSYKNFIDGVNDIIKMEVSINEKHSLANTSRISELCNAINDIVSRLDTDITKILHDWYIRNKYPLDWYKDNTTSHDLIDFVKMYDRIDNHAIMLMCSPYYKQSKIEFVNLSGIDKMRIYDLKVDNIVDIKGDLYFFKSYKNNGKFGCDVEYQNCLTGSVYIENYKNDSQKVKFMGVMTITEKQRRDGTYLNLGDLLGDGVFKKRNELKYGDVILYGTKMYFIREFDEKNNYLRVTRCTDGEESSLIISKSSELEFLGNVPEVSRKIDKVTNTILENKDMCSEYGNKLYKPFKNFGIITTDILRKDVMKSINERIYYNNLTTITELYNFVTNKDKL